MHSDYSPCTYERIIIFKRVPFWAYWFVVSLLTFLVGETLVRLFADSHYFWAQCLLSIASGLLPTAYILFSHRFQDALEEVSSIAWEDSEEFKEWLKARSTRIFTLKFWPAKVVSSLITILGLITVALLGSPFQSPLVTMLALLWFAYILVICGHGLYICMYLLYTLREVVLRPVEVPFYRIHHPAIERLQSCYYFVAVSIFLAYLALALTIRLGPYGLVPALQIWLTILAFYPLSLFLWSFFHIHAWLKRIKSSYLRKITPAVQQALDDVLSHGTLDDVERLDRMMGIQARLQSVSEWPLMGEGAITLIVALVPPIIQISIYVMEGFRP